MTRSKYILNIVATIVFALPLFANAHAVPVASEPASSGRLETAPTEVRITFSERIDASASSITVDSPSGMSMSERVSTDEDGRTLLTPVMADGEGTYIVRWAVVSADDGHFTKGGYAFAVGTSTLLTSLSENTEIVKVATVPEALVMTVELMGNGIIWAAILLFAFGIRPLLRSGKFEDVAPLLKRGYSAYLLSGVLLAIVGAALQLLVKANDLASLQSVGLSKAFTLYLHTAAGGATFWRMIAVVVVGCVFFVFRSRIVKAVRITPYEISLMLLMCVFAYFRAIISHATANPFHPELSVIVNFFHLIEKDLWAGILIALLVLVMLPRTRNFLAAVLPQASRMLALDLAAVSVTACYIVWLHLKSFDNVFSTEWGAVFLELFVLAILTVAMRTYHVFARHFTPRMFSKLLPFTLAAECAFAILVVYCSSVVIITSPPLGHPDTIVFSARDRGVTISLQRSIYEDDMLLLSESEKGIRPPVATLETSGGSTIVLELEKRFDGAYVFPRALLPQSSSTLNVTLLRPEAYDAHATFPVSGKDFDEVVGWESRRPFDPFAVLLIATALLSIIFAFGLFHLSSIPNLILLRSAMGYTDILAVCSLLATFFLGAFLITNFHGSYLQNPFKHRCESDGNMWHTMQPMKAGMPTSKRPAEGCMWGMGKFIYHFPDQREYSYYRSLGPTEVTVTSMPKTPVAGMPTRLTVVLKGADGSPAEMFVDMEKLLHLVIISKDQSVFAHLHPDDIRPLTSEEIKNSTFTFDYTFPKAGEYLLSFDYAHGVVLGSKQLKVAVSGAPPQGKTIEFASPGVFKGYSVELQYPQLVAGEVATLRYIVTKNGKPVSLVPYLSAALHLAAVKNDLSWFLHAHGEVHPAGQAYPPITVKDGKVVHSMAMMLTPNVFTLPIDAHLIFPSPGLYTLWGQFKTESGEVVATSFTVRVE